MGGCFSCFSCKDDVDDEVCEPPPLHPRLDLRAVLGAQWSTPVELVMTASLRAGDKAGVQVQQL